MAKQVARGPGQIGIPTRVQPPVSTIDQLDYDIHRDPDLASRDADFLAKYLGQLDDQDMTILGDLTYGQYGGYFSDEEYKRAMLTDSSLYGEVDFTEKDLKFKLEGASNYSDRMVKWVDPITGKKNSMNIIDFEKEHGSYEKGKKAISKDFLSNAKANYVKDLASGGFLDVKDKALQESYFGKMSQGEGVTSMYERAKTAGQGDAFSEKLTGSEGYSSMIKKMAEASSFGMMEGYADAITTAGSAYTNTLDSQSINALIDEDEFRLGL